MKQLIVSLAMVFLLLTMVSCGPKDEAIKEVIPPVNNNPYLFTLEEYPRLAGSTVTSPLGCAIMQKLTGVSVSKARESTVYISNVDAYQSLIKGTSDIILAYEANEGIQNIIAESGVDLEYHVICRDALVFIVNADNPVEDLSIDQIRKIYSGSITNWQEIGGNQEKLIPLQRNESSVSQDLIRKLVMKELPLMEAPLSSYKSSMKKLVEEIAVGKNSDGLPIGFAVYYYINVLQDNPNIKSLSVEGIEATNQTIREQTYPLTNDIYAVIRSDEPADSNTRKLLDWILSPEGMEIIEEVGYVPTFK